MDAGPFFPFRPFPELRGRFGLFGALGLSALFGVGAAIGSEARSTPGHGHPAARPAEIRSIAAAHPAEARSLSAAHPVEARSTLAVHPVEPHGTPEIRRPTEVGGVLPLPEVWTRAKSPYLLTADVFIPKEGRLVIEPGVVIHVAKLSSSQPAADPGSDPALRHSVPSSAPAAAHSSASAPPHHPALRHSAPALPPPEDWADAQYATLKVEGAFYAIGTEEMPIVFEPLDYRPGQIGWDGIRIKNRNHHAVEIAFVTFRAAHRAVHAENCSFSVHHNVFEGNNTGLSVVKGSEVFALHNNFTRQKSAGILVERSAAQIVNNLFFGNRGHGVWADGRRGLVLRHNGFHQNGEGHCRRCPEGTLEKARATARGDSADANGNLVANPVFEGSESYLAALETDPASATAPGRIRDLELARLASAVPTSAAGAAAAPAADARPTAAAGKTAQGLVPARGLVPGAGKSSASFKPLGTGPYRLSRYSPFIDAGLTTPLLQDRDGSAADMGIHGGKMGRITGNPL